MDLWHKQCNLSVRFPQRILDIPHRLPAGTVGADINKWRGFSNHLERGLISLTPPLPFRYDARLRIPAGRYAPRLLLRHLDAHH